MQPRTGRRRWTDDQPRDAVARSRSIYGVLRELGLRVGGGQHEAIKRRIRSLGLDASHFTGRGWNQGDERGLLAGHRRTWDLQEILVRNSPYGGCSSALKRRLLSAGLLRHRCYECDAPPEWRGRPLVLRLDHVNGDRRDHRPKNLRLLCPNCDSQTPTFAGRNKGRIPW